VQRAFRDKLPVHVVDCDCDKRRSDPDRRDPSWVELRPLDPACLTFLRSVGPHGAVCLANPIPGGEPMARRVFYSFHYKPDCQRASQVRNAGVVDGNKPAQDNDWETITGGGDAAIKRWIAEQMEGRTCSVVLVGAATAGRKWINYEIEQSWMRGMGVVGVRIHKLKDFDKEQAAKGASPFEHLKLGNASLSSIVELHDPAGADSKEVYATIKDKLPSWIEKAIEIRALYS
jgi:hypothetical protein